MAESDPQHPRRTDIDGVIEPEQAAEAEHSRGQRIPGRDFAGTSFAANEHEQTADHRGNSHAHVADDTVADPSERTDGQAPRDES